MGKTVSIPRGYWKIWRRTPSEDKGNISLEDYDTLRIRYERKLGNKETVSKLQEQKGFKPSIIKEKKAKIKATVKGIRDSKILIKELQNTLKGAK